MENSVKNLIQFIDHSPSCFHVIENAKNSSWNMILYS